MTKSNVVGLLEMARPVLTKNQMKHDLSSLYENFELKFGTWCRLFIDLDSYSLFVTGSLVSGWTGNCALVRLFLAAAGILICSDYLL